MIALFRYQLVCLIRGQRYLPPLLLFGVVVAVGSRGDGGPLLPLYGLWTAAMLICTVWLTMVVLADEDPAQERITAVSARRGWHPLVADTAVTLTFCLLMTIYGLGFPLVVGVRPASAVDFLVGAASQLAAACFGVTVGTFCSRKVIPATGLRLSCGGPAGPGAAPGQQDPVGQRVDQIAVRRTSRGHGAPAGVDHRCHRGRRAGRRPARRPCHPPPALTLGSA